MARQMALGKPVRAMSIQLHPLQNGGAVVAGVCPQCNGRGVAEFCEVKPGELDRGHFDPDAFHDSKREERERVDPAHRVRALEGGYFEVDGYSSQRRCRCAVEKAAKAKATEQAEHLRATQNWASWEARRTSIFVHDKDAQREVVCDTLKQWDFRRSLYLFGSLGCGKTHAVNAMALKAVGNGVPALYVNIHDLLGRQRATFRSPSPSGGRTPLENAVSAPVLLLDDLGVDKLSSWVAETVYDLCDKRLRGELPTVYVSNLSPSRLQRYLTMPFEMGEAEATHIAQNGQRIFSRIMASCDVFEFRRRK